MSGLGDRPATRLSGGQQQRVALARAIVRKPRLLLLDEPLSNLDAALREEMRNELRRLQQQIGVTTVYVTHDQTEALEMSDRIAVMDNGNIAQIGEPREIYFEPSNAFVARFVGAANWLHGVVLEANRSGVSSVKLKSGEIIRCMLKESMKTSQSVMVSVRPESTSLSAPDAGGADDGNRLRGRVVFAGFMGNLTRYQIDVGGGLVQAYGAPHAAYKVGDAVAIAFPAGSATAFAAD
jgi:iron(III) transport system ATP-binding protein